MSVLIAEPERVAELIPLYDKGIGQARELRLVWREHALHDGATSSVTDVVAVSVPIR